MLFVTNDIQNYQVVVCRYILRDLINYKWYRLINIVIFKFTVIYVKDVSYQLNCFCVFEYILSTVMQRCYMYIVGTGR